MTKFEYMASGGPGTLVSLGVTDNNHSMLAHTKKEVLKAEARGSSYEKITTMKAPVSNETPIGQK